MTQYIRVIRGGVTYNEMVNYVTETVDTVVASGIQVQGIGDIIVTTESGITYVDGTELIAETAILWTADSLIT